MIFRRGKHVSAPDPDSGWVHCEWCGEAVPVRPDGRCGLGHRVTAPVREDEPSHVKPFLAPDEGAPSEAGSAVAAEGPGPVPVSEPDVEIEAEDPFAGLYGVLDEDGDESPAESDDDRP